MLRHVRMALLLAQNRLRLPKTAIALALAAIALPGVDSPRITKADTADSLLRHTAPHKWIEPFIPEKLPELKLPVYFTDLEKAQAQAFHGRYKQALITLAKVKPEKPE